MKKVVIGFTMILLLLLPVTTFANESVSIKNSQSSLEVTVEVTGSGRVYDISTYIRNNEDEQVIVTFICMPGGGYEIYNKNGKMVYFEPQFVWLVLWDLTLEPGQTELLYSSIWHGVDLYKRILPSGDYSIKGVGYSEDGDIFSEPVNIYLPKTRNKCTLDFLNQFPLLVRFLSLFNLFN
jgi:hypothetical protein